MTAPSGFTSVDQWALGTIHRALGRPPIRLRCASGAEVSPAATPPLGLIEFSDRAALWRVVFDPEVGFGEGYAQGRILVQGDLVSMLEAVSLVMPEPKQQNRWVRMVLRWMNLVQANTLSGARKNIHRHYDLSNDFYSLWLDSQLVYSGAYFESQSATLEEAQSAKMDYICRKLQLRPGERVVECGCGWGAMALHMAGHYGVSVRAFNISRQQLLLARQKAKETGLSRRVEFIEDDYRNISGQADVFVSLGMLEHVGKEHYPEMGRVIERTLGKSGRGLLQFVGRNHSQPLSPWIRKRIFPRAYVPTAGEVLAFLEPGDFSVFDVENLRPHYARTLEQWLERFENSGEQVSKRFGPEFVRIWRLYLAQAIAGYRAGALQLFQVLFAGARCQQTPWTRAHLYESGRQTGTGSAPVHRMP